MLGIGDRERQWIGKDRRRLLERYGVFPGVRESFLRIPLEQDTLGGASQSLSRRPRSPTSSTTGGSSDSQRFRVTHPFHPLSGHEYELVGFAHTWGEHRVFFREPGQSRVRSLPASWTGVGGADAFLVLSAGRSHFRPEDLVQLALLLSELKSGCK